MHSIFKEFHDKQYKNYYGDYDDFINEYENSILKFHNENSIFWLKKSGKIYFIRYGVNDLDCINEFVNKHDSELRNINCIFEIKSFVEENEKLTNLLLKLTNNGFEIQSDHSSLVKNYFKDNNEVYDYIYQVSDSDIESLVNLISKNKILHRYLSKPEISKIISNEYENIFLYKTNNIQGYIIINMTPSDENIGFIRDIYANSESEKYNEIIRNLLLTTLNYFYQNGIDKAFTWINTFSYHRKKMLKDYGFKHHDFRIILLARSAKEIIRNA